jgi:hypothetical protein
MFRAIARHLIPDVGTYDVENGLHDEDGSVYRRGGTVYHSNAAFGASLRWLTDVQLPAGQRTVIASPTAFGVLSSDDATPLNLGGAGLLEPAPSTVLGGVLYIGGGVMYGGSRKTADYSTGTVAVTLGSKVGHGHGHVVADERGRGDARARRCGGPLLPRRFGGLGHGARPLGVLRRQRRRRGRRTRRPGWAPPRRGASRGVALLRGGGQARLGVGEPDHGVRRAEHDGDDCWATGRRTPTTSTTTTTSRPARTWWRSRRCRTASSRSRPRAST